MRVLSLFVTALTVSACQAGHDPYVSPLADAGLYTTRPPMVATVDEAMHGRTPGQGMARAATPSAQDGSFNRPLGLYAALEDSTATAAIPSGLPHAEVQPSTTDRPVPDMTSALFALHLASFSDAALVPAAVERLRAQGLSELAGLQARVEKVHLGPDRGWYHRVKMGPVPSEADGQRRCAALEKAGHFCKLTNFAGETVAG